MSENPSDTDYPLASRQADQEALLAFFTPEGVGRAVRQSNFTAEEAFQILGDIARGGKTDAGRLKAIDMYFERVESALRLARLMQSDTHRQMVVSGGASHAPVSVEVTETERDRISTSVERTEALLRRQLTTPAVPCTSDDVIDVAHTLAPHTTSGDADTDTDTEETDESYQPQAADIPE